MIRVATKEDMTVVLDLMRQLSSHEFTEKQFEDCYLFNISKECVLVYEKEGTVIGCLVYNIHFPMHYSRKTAEIINLVIDNDFCNQGIGKQMLLEFEKIADLNECVIIEVDSGNWRKDAHRFYCREGFNCTHHKFTKELL